MRNRQTGFTLIELLVVIAIIAILAAILFPIFTSAKGKGMQATCANNMRQISLAFLEYADDNNGIIPPLNCFLMYEDGTPAPPTAPTGPTKPGSVMKYLRNWTVLVCPADPYYRKKVTGTLQWTYTINGHMTREDPHFPSGGKTIADRHGVPVNYSRSPARTPLIIDESTSPNSYVSEYRVNDANFIFEDRTSDRHKGANAQKYRVNGRDSVAEGRANLSYLDGHTGTIPGLIKWKEHPELFCYPAQRQ